MFYIAIKLIIAPPRYGKSTMLAFLARKALKKGLNVYSNVYINGTNMLDISDFNFYLIENGIVLIDEAGIDFDNRAWKKFSDKLVRFFKLHGHYHLDVYLVSQDYDIDSKIRNLATDIFIVKKSLFYPYVFKWRSVVQKVDINEDGSDISHTFAWKFLLFDLHYHLAFPLWKLFNSHYQDILNVKDWKKWCKENEYLMIRNYTINSNNSNIVVSMPNNAK